MNTEQREILVKVRQTWNNSTSFTTHAMARDSFDRSCDANSKEAVCWCFHGLLTLLGVPCNNEARDFYNKVMIKHSKIIFPHHDYKSLLHDAMDLNDRLLHHNMIKILDHVLEHELIAA